MKKFEVESKLKSMVGKLFMYHKVNQRVLRFENKESCIKITTDVEDIVIKWEDAGILNDFLPVEEDLVFKEAPAATAPSIINQSVIGSSAKELKEILMENIRQIKDNKEFIPQAVEINNNVKSIIDLAKAEVDLFKALRN